MGDYVDHDRWSIEAQRPDWYLTLRDEYETLLDKARASAPNKRRAIADEVYSFFEGALEQREIALGASGPAWDAERGSVDTAIVHHTNLPGGISSRRIDAIHLTRIYARYYADPAPIHAAIRGTAIFSGHYRGDRQVFYGYHRLIRSDGSVERLLEDDETGWQAGNWDINCRSVGICLDGHFDREPPPMKMIEALARLLRDDYAAIPAQRVYGHREINPATTCPGEPFLTGWKDELLALLDG